MHCTFDNNNNNNNAKIMHLLLRKCCVCRMKVFRIHINGSAIDNVLYDAVASLMLARRMLGKCCSCCTRANSVKRKQHHVELLSQTKYSSWFSNIWEQPAVCASQIFRGIIVESYTLATLCVCFSGVHIEQTILCIQQSKKYICERIQWKPDYNDGN